MQNTGTIPINDGDPLAPPAPKPARFDSALEGWVLSQHADVLAALREPGLEQIAGERKPGRDQRAQSQVHEEVQADLSRVRTMDWQAEMAVLARQVMSDATVGQPINLVQEVVQPWSIALTVKMSGTGRIRARHLASIAARLSAPLDDRWERSQAESDCFRMGHSLTSRWVAWRRKTAKAELERMFQRQGVSMGKSMFFGLFQTLPHFLAKAWLALLRHPDEMERLRARPDLLPSATEELLRYAGVVHTLFRRANTDVIIEQTKVARGERVILKVASANRDPSKFIEPDRVDVGRRATGQLGLGTGTHACVGAMLVRMAFAAVTPVFLDALPALQSKHPVRWNGDSTVCSPMSIPVVFQRRA
jgi:cytochrome P450